MVHLYALMLFHIYFYIRENIGISVLRLEDGGTLTSKQSAKGIIFEPKKTMEILWSVYPTVMWCVIINLTESNQM